jgi:hypothetical protein
MILISGIEGSIVRRVQRLADRLRAVNVDE